MSLKITESISLPNDAVTPEVDGYRVEVLIQRFAEKTMFGVGAKQCWEWQGYKRNGYGSISMHDQTLADAAGYTAGAGAFNNPRGRLKTLGLIEYPQPGMVRARDLLFPL